MKRMSLVFFAIILCFSFTGCSKTKQEVPVQESKDDFMYSKKENIVSDSQYNTNAPVIFTDSLWATPEDIRYEQGDKGNVKAYFINSINDTKVFVYVGIPATATVQKKVPAVVLVHGGGGTAFFEWVNLWTERGYAAIAMDTEGNMPSETSLMSNSDHKKSIHKSGPPNSAFADKYSSPESQWVYHAIAAVIASTSFIKSFDSVDESKIGVIGISYGGFITANVVGYDDRFAFAVPVYGAVSNKGTNTAFGKLTANQNTDLWDDASILAESRTPILFVNGNKDFHFSPIATSDCFLASKYAELAIITDLLHSHTHGAEVSQIFTFADSIVLAKKGLPKVTEQPSKTKPSIKVYSFPDSAIVEADIVYTQDVEINSLTNWSSKTATVNGDLVSGTIPQSATNYYFNIYDNKGNQISSKVVTM